MDTGLKVNNGDTIGKTIIFAKNQSHARFIETCFNKMYPSLKGKFLEVVTHSSDQPEETINLFKQANKLPQIVVSVDMLDTGIDVPEILNLVFFKPVRSSAKYWQMVGRGTRLCADVFDIGKDKKEFYIFDYCGNIEFFGDNPKGIEPGATISITQRIFQLKVKLAVSLESLIEDDELNEFRNQLLDELLAEVIRLDENSFVNRPYLRLIKAFSDRNYWNNLTEDKVRSLDKTITALIVNADPDFDAKKLDVISYRIMDYYLNEDKSIANLIQQVKTTSNELLKQTTIPHVAAKKDLLKKSLNDTFWQNIDLKALENFRIEIRELMKFLDKPKQPQVYTNFTDELTGQIEIHDILIPYEGLPTYKARVESFIRKHRTFLVINKIKNNQPISGDELAQIKNLLFEEDPEAASHLDEALNGENFVLFIRSIIGLEASVAKEMFADFINRPNISAEQMTFMNTLIDYLTQNGTINKSMLFDRPFTDINQNGILGLFEDEDAFKIIKIIDGLNQSIA
ncbi:type I restriction-modification enzyme R subunit C-terminal domain-containing protein [Pedobacter frigidisoli]|nr:type I restriction-modification enzyme R subunit C-terminal domain-containing protein [Pedobacter frigidisoli]